MYCIYNREVTQMPSRKGNENQVRYYVGSGFGPSMVKLITTVQRQHIILSSTTTVYLQLSLMHASVRFVGCPALPSQTIQSSGSEHPRVDRYSFIGTLSEPSSRSPSNPLQIFGGSSARSLRTRYTNQANKEVGLAAILPMAGVYMGVNFC
jgi:hypothetical protein